MNIAMQYKQYRSDGIFGQMYDETGAPVCVFLTRAFPGPSGSWIPATPPGTYHCVRFASPEFGFDVFMVQNVPGHDHIEMHIGNWQKDSKGCFLLGEAFADSAEGQMITNSEKSFQSFMDSQDGIDGFTMVIS